MRMLLFVILIVMAGGAVLSGAQEPATPAPSQPAVDPEPTSYAVGRVLGRDTRAGLTEDGMGVDLDLLAKGFADALNGQKPDVPRAEMTRIRRAVHNEMETRRVRRLLAESPKFQQLYDTNRSRGRRFQDLFGKQPGVVELPSGAQYLVVRPGDGPVPGPDDAVSVKVRAQLLDRSLIDDGTTPFEVEVNSTLRGGTEILQLMRVGAQWQVVLPPELAFGEGGRFPDIGPNETVVMTLDLLEITRSGEGGSR